MGVYSERILCVSIGGIYERLIAFAEGAASCRMALPHAVPMYNDSVAYTGKVWTIQPHLDIDRQLVRAVELGWISAISLSYTPARATYRTVTQYQARDLLEVGIGIWSQRSTIS